MPHSYQHGTAEIKANMLSLQIAVLKEVEGKGPFCSLVMGVVVLKDVLVIVAFAVNMQLVPMVRWGEEMAQPCPPECGADVAFSLD